METKEATINDVVLRQLESMSREISSIRSSLTHMSGTTRARPTTMTLPRSISGLSGKQLASTFNALFEALTQDEIETLLSSQFMDLREGPLNTLNNRVEELLRDAYKSGVSREQAEAEVRMGLIMEFPELDQDILYPLVRLIAHLLWNEK